jgi:4-hydroxyphenylacetate 3-monooxygenase
MPARTGKEFLKGLRGAREIWVDGERVTDVVDHPKLSGAAHALAEVYDLQHKHADICLMPDPETGEPIPVSHMIPRSREDLAKRGKALRQVAEYSMGLMGRTPDYMNVTYAGFAGRPDEWGLNGNAAGAERLVAYQKFLRRGDISLTHTIVQPTVDKATRCARSKRPSTASWCAVPACWPPWRRSPTSSRSIPPRRCRKAPTPMRSPFVCR